MEGYKVLKFLAKTRALLQGAGSNLQCPFCYEMTYDVDLDDLNDVQQRDWFVSVLSHRLEHVQDGSCPMMLIVREASDDDKAPPGVGKVTWDFGGTLYEDVPPEFAARACDLPVYFSQHEVLPGLEDSASDEDRHDEIQQFLDALSDDYGYCILGFEWV